MEEPKYIRFELVGASSTGLTKIWKVKTIDRETLLGKVKWYAAWRCYSFFISSEDGEFDLVFEKTCLRNIADFCEYQTELQKGKRRLDGK